jgi:hypothetical protein
LGAQGPLKVFVTEPHPRVTAVCPHFDRYGPAVSGLAKIAKRHRAASDQHFAQKIAKRIQSGSVTPQQNCGVAVERRRISGTQRHTLPASHWIFNF